MAVEIGVLAPHLFHLILCPNGHKANTFCVLFSYSFFPANFVTKEGTASNIYPLNYVVTCVLCFSTSAGSSLVFSTLHWFRLVLLIGSDYGNKPSRLFVLWHTHTQRSGIGISKKTLYYIYINLNLYILLAFCRFLLKNTEGREA